MRKTVTSKENLMAVLDLLDSMGMRYWVDGGWGVDILVGSQNRSHRDVDIDFDGAYTERLLSKLKDAGYRVTADWGPIRVELRHPDRGYIDVHPLTMAEDGSAVQAGLFGKSYQFEAAWFTSAVFEGRTIPCISVDAQRLFHTGYRLRKVDKIDMEYLNRAEQPRK